MAANDLKPARSDRVVVGHAASQGASMVLTRGNYNNERSRANQGRAAFIPQGLPAIRAGGPSATPEPTTAIVDLRDDLPVPPSSTLHENHAQVEDRLYISNIAPVMDEHFLKSKGITHIINTAVEIPNRFPQSFRYLNLRLNDDPTFGKEDLFAVLEPTYLYISQVLKHPNARVVVHCAAGISRSASVVVYYLMRSRGWGFERALSFLKTKRAIVNPNDWYRKQLTDASRMLEELARSSREN